MPRFIKEIADEICIRTAEGEPLTRIVKSIPSPFMKGKKFSVNTVYAWLDTKTDDPDRIAFYKRYARARQDQGDTIYFEIQEIEHKMQLPKKIRDPETGEMITNPDYIEPNQWFENYGGWRQGRVLVDSKKWRAGRMMPKKYGDKLDVDVTGDVNVTVQDKFPVSRKG